MVKKQCRIACVIGTRPEVIKMAPVIDRLRKNNIDTYIINTAQHRQLLDDMLTIFSINPDVDLNIMQDNQALATLTGNLFVKMEELYQSQSFDCILAQGDTTTTLVAAMVAFYHKIPFGHIEAGLRSYNMYQPFPEEMNRVVISKVATWHFAPTEDEKKQLVKEDVNANNILVTGNTVIDSLQLLVSKNTPVPVTLDKNKRMILVTLHRRESFGKPIEDIFSAIIAIIEKFQDIEMIYPVHPNPNVRHLAEKMLGNHPRIRLIPPVSYDQFVSLMKASYFIMSDSGGIQEEAPALDKPILILRELTERPMVVEQGMGILVGSDKEKIIANATMLLTQPQQYQMMQRHHSPYGDGKASQRIVDFLIRRLVEDSV